MSVALSHSLILATVGLLAANPLVGAVGGVTEYITLDQFGYRPGDPKIAVIRDPVNGFNGGESYTAGATYQVRRWSDDAVVFTGSPTLWNSGNTDAQSGDRGWHFNFSSFQTAGDYYLYDVERNTRSFRFLIHPNVYKDVLRQACRMFYYQREGFAHLKAYDFRRSDGVTFLGTGQASEARSFDDRNNATTARDCRGGWWDAGDLNKYTTFLNPVFHHLLTAYRRNPAMFNNLSLDIPESGNAIPDLLDEVRWSLDYLARIQAADGSLLQEVGGTDTTELSPPSSDTTPRYYVPASTSATIIAAGVFAHAALATQNLSALSTVAADWRSRAIKAWDFAKARLDANTLDTNKDLGGSGAADSDRTADEQRSQATVAATYLFALTGESRFNDYVRDHLSENSGMKGGGNYWWTPYLPDEGQAMMFYASLANAHQSAKDQILNVRNTRRDSGIYLSNDGNLYRAYIPQSGLTYSMNQWFNNVGDLVMQMVDANLDAGNHANYRDKALSMIHWTHGVNPQSHCYLTNMARFGAEKSVNTLYHGWFQTGSAWSDARVNAGPPAGYQVGGPHGSWNSGWNLTYAGTSIELDGQPPLKAYTDRNEGDRCWVVNEPGIYYQAGFIDLLSRFVDDTPGPGNDQVAVVKAPATAARGSTVQVSVTYRSPAARKLKVMLFENGYTYLAGDFTTPAASPDGTTYTASIAVPTTAVLGGGNWKVELTDANDVILGDWTDAVTIQAATAPPPVDALTTPTAPATVVQGLAYQASVQHDTNSSDRRVALMYFSIANKGATNEAWTYQAGAFPEVTGKATVSGTVTIPATCPVGNGAWVFELQNRAGTQTLKSLNQAATTAAPVDDISTLSAPATVTRGSAATVSVQHETNSPDRRLAMMYFSIANKGTANEVWTYQAGSFPEITGKATKSAAINVPASCPLGNASWIVELQNKAGTTVQDRLSQAATTK